MDAGSPGAAKAVVTRHRYDTWNKAINAAARILMDERGLKLGRLRALKK